MSYKDFARLRNAGVLQGTSCGNHPEFSSRGFPDSSTRELLSSYLPEFHLGVHSEFLSRSWNSQSFSLDFPRISTQTSYRDFSRNPGVLQRMSCEDQPEISHRGFSRQFSSWELFLGYLGISSGSSLVPPKIMVFPKFLPGFSGISSRDDYQNHLEISCRGFPRQFFPGASLELFHPITFTEVLRDVLRDPEFSCRGFPDGPSWEFLSRYLLEFHLGVNLEFLPRSWNSHRISL